MAAGALVLAYFAIRSNARARRGGHPLFHVSLFRYRLFAAGTGLGFLFQFTVGGLLFVLPVFLQSALQLNAMSTALVLLPYSLGIFVFALGAARLPATLNAVRVVQVGLILMLVGGIWVHQTAALQLNWSALLPALFCFGAGAGLTLSRLTELTLSQLAVSELGEGTGGNSTSGELGVAFGVAVLGSVFLLLVYGNFVDAYGTYHLVEMTEVERNEAIIELEDWAAQLSDSDWEAYLASLPAKTADAYQAIVNAAFLHGYRATLRILIGVIALMIFVSLIMARRIDEGEDGA